MPWPFHQEQNDYNDPQMYGGGPGSGASSGGSAMPWGAIIPAAASVAGGLIGANSASNASKQQAASDAQVLQFEREKEAERRREWDLTVAAQKAQWEQRQAQLAPYNQLRASIAAKYGVKIPMSATEYKAPEMPAEWKPGDPVPTGGASTPTPSPAMGMPPPTPTAAQPVAASGMSPQLNLGNIHDWSGSIWGGLRG